MKNVFIAAILLLTFCSCGTDQGDETTYIYTVSNESGVQVKVKSYISYLPDVSPVITTIPKGQEVTKTYEDGLPPSGYSFKSFFGESPHRDSIIVIYDNDKYNIFTRIGCAGSDRNPLNSCIYDDTVETFTFTEEDYENAESCEGECN